MNCPFCGSEMVEGYVQSAREVYFTTHKHKFSFVPKNYDISLTEHNLTCPSCAAYCCSDCKKIIVDYSHQNGE